MSSYILDDLKPDVKENDILKLDNELLSILLTDRSSGANIIWATGDYAETRGCDYAFDAPITVASITGKNGGYSPIYYLFSCLSSWKSKLWMGIISFEDSILGNLTA